MNDELIDTKYYSKNLILINLDDKDYNYIKNNSKYNKYKSNKVLKNALNSIKNNDEKKFKKVINMNEDIIDEKINGSYLLHYACKYGCFEILSYILLNNYNYKISDSYGIYPQHYAIISNKVIIIDILIVFNYDINVKDKNNNTCLHYAVLNDNIQMVKTLLNYNIDINVKNNDEKRAIDIIDKTYDCYDLLKQYYN